MARMDKKWVALCSAAVTAVYAAAYITTETEASIQSPPTYIQASPLPAGIRNGGEPPSASSSISAPNSKSKTGGLYKDGTYTGTGRNRRGSIQVAVTVKNDAITDVEISRFAMHYSESDVVGLPAEVVRKQSAQVANVSGATYSVQAFKDAIQEALAQAQNVS